MVNCCTLWRLPGSILGTHSALQREAPSQKGKACGCFLFWGSAWLAAVVCCEQAQQDDGCIPSSPPRSTYRPPPCFLLSSCRGQVVHDAGEQQHAGPYPEGTRSPVVRLLGGMAQSPAASTLVDVARWGLARKKQALQHADQQTTPPENSSQREVDVAVAGGQGGHGGHPQLTGRGGGCCRQDGVWMAGLGRETNPG